MDQESSAGWAADASGAIMLRYDISSKLSLYRMMLEVRGLNYRGLTLEVYKKYLGQRQEPMGYKKYVEGITIATYGTRCSDSS